MSDLSPLLPEKRLTELIDEKMRELGISQRELEEDVEIAQPLISRSLRYSREFKYSEAQRIIEYLLSKRSFIPGDLRAIDYATAGEDLVYSYDDELVGEVVSKLRSNRFTQIPVRNRESGRWMGVVTEQGILKLLFSPVGRVKAKNCRQIVSMPVKESGLVEGILECPERESLVMVAQMLIHYYAVLLTSDLGEVKGIVTRADILKLLENC